MHMVTWGYQSLPLEANVAIINKEWKKTTYLEGQLTRLFGCASVYMRVRVTAAMHACKFVEGLIDVPKKGEIIDKMCKVAH